MTDRYVSTSSTPCPSINFNVAAILPSPFYSFIVPALLKMDASPSSDGNFIESTASNGQENGTEKFLTKDEDQKSEEEVIYAVPDQVFKRKLDPETIESELEKWLEWLNNMEKELNFNAPTGALPETAENQLEAFLIQKNEIDSNVNTIDDLLEQAANSLSAEDNSQNSTAAHNYMELREKWDQLLDLSNEKKKKLEEAREQALVLNNAMGDTADWLIDAEENLVALEKILISLGKALRQKKLIREHCEDKDAFHIRKNLTSLKNHFRSLANETHETAEAIAMIIDMALNAPEHESDEEHCTPL